MQAAYVGRDAAVVVYRVVIDLTVGRVGGIHGVGEPVGVHQGRRDAERVRGAAAGTLVGVFAADVLTM